MLDTKLILLTNEAFTTFDNNGVKTVHPVDDPIEGTAPAVGATAWVPLVNTNGLPYRGQTLLLSLPGVFTATADGGYQYTHEIDPAQLAAPPFSDYVQQPVQGLAGALGASWLSIIKNRVW